MLEIVKNWPGVRVDISPTRVRRESTHNQVTGYELTPPLWVRVDFPGTG